MVDSIHPRGPDSEEGDALTAEATEVLNDSRCFRDFRDNSSGI